MLIRNISFFMCFLSLTHPLLSSPPQEKTQVAAYIKLNDTEFESFIQTAEKPVIVYFCALSCCRCMSMKPIFRRVANELKEDYLFVTVNCDEGLQIAEKYLVTSLPTFKVIKNNAVIGTITEFVNEESLIALIENAVHGKMTQNTLLSAIKVGDKKLIATCLACADIDVNGLIQMHDIGIVPMTPLMLATLQVIYEQDSLDIVSMLLNAGAQIDLEIHFLDPTTDIGFFKKTARSIAAETAQLNVEEIVAKISSDDFLKNFENDNEESLRHTLLQMKEKGSSLLKIFQDVPEK